MPIAAVALCGLVLIAPRCAAHAGSTSPPRAAVPGLVHRDGRVEMTTGSQKLVFTRERTGYRLRTYVRDGVGWRDGFDAGRPVLTGPLFGDFPSHYRILSRTTRLKSVEFYGRHDSPGYDWTMRVSAGAGSPLFHFRITCRLREPLALNSPQPVVALWLRGAKPEVCLDQGPDSIYGAAGIPHGYGLPAAYLWRDRSEAAVFFDMTPMRWMQRTGVARFHDVRIMTERQGDAAGLGMHFKRLSGSPIPAGDMRIDFHLYQGTRPRRPSTLEALDTTVRLFAPLHPSASGWPRDQFTGRPASWDHVASATLFDLMQPGTMAVIEAPWRDSPTELVAPQQTMVVHPAVARRSVEEVAAGWDFSTVNNHLTPWLLLARLRGDRAALDVGRRKLDALPRFFDPRAGLIRHGTRQPDHVGDLEMCWQNLFFHTEALRAASAAGPDAFNPAVAGRVLMSTAGWREMAHNVGYVLPQWFDPYRKQPLVQNDLRQLGLVREPWQNGAYAYLMMSAYDIAGDAEFLNEARRALDTLMRHMRYRVTNDVYDRTYSDPGEFPITELFGNALGIAAARRIYGVTREDRFLRYSRDFLNTLLRLTPWYEDETDPVSRELKSAGLFFPHCGAHVLTPWETAEAHLMLVWVLKHDPANPLRKLLLRLANLNRTNSFTFFPAFWTPTVRAHDREARSATGAYFPIEPFYSLEGEGGHRGATAAYMASLALWNDWLFEALATTSDHTMMVLNLDAMDGYEAAIEGLQRSFVVYNPTTSSRTCTVRFRHLAKGRYDVSLGTRARLLSADELDAGLTVTLAEGADIRVSIRRRDAAEAIKRLARGRASANAIVRAYAALQQTPATRPEHVRSFADAMTSYRASRLDRARAIADGLVKSVAQRDPRTPQPGQPPGGARH